MEDQRSSSSGAESACGACQITSVLLGVPARGHKPMTASNVDLSQLAGGGGAPPCPQDGQLTAPLVGNAVFVAGREHQANGRGCDRVKRAIGTAPTSTTSNRTPPAIADAALCRCAQPFENA